MSVVMAAPPDSIHPETVPNDVPGWDSLSHLTLVVTLEQQLGVVFSQAEIERMTDVGTICAIIEGKREA